MSLGDDSVPIGESSSLGFNLRALRLQRRYSGKRLAELARMSQSKISRIETGVTIPSPADIIALAHALQLGERLADELAEDARRLREPSADWASGDFDLAVRQQDTEQMEASATDFKVFQTSLVIGLLQTGGYAEAVLSGIQRLRQPAGGPARAVSARMHRQAILDDPDKRFDFVMAEAALSNRVCPPEDMLAQIRRIRDVARRPNVSISIIPVALARWTIPPIVAFEILDEKYVFVDLYDAGLSKHGQLDDDLYCKVFAAMKAQATADVDLILEKYRDLYVRELTRTDADAE